MEERGSIEQDSIPRDYSNKKTLGSGVIWVARCMIFALASHVPCGRRALRSRVNSTGRRRRAQPERPTVPCERRPHHSRPVLDFPPTSPDLSRPLQLSPATLPPPPIPPSCNIIASVVLRDILSFLLPVACSPPAFFSLFSFSGTTWRTPRHYPFHIPLLPSAWKNIPRSTTTLFFARGHPSGLVSISSVSLDWSFRLSLPCLPRTPGLFSHKATWTSPRCWRAPCRQVHHITTPNPHAPSKTPPLPAAPAALLLPKIRKSQADMILFLLCRCGDASECGTAAASCGGGGLCT